MISKHWNNTENIIKKISSYLGMFFILSVVSLPSVYAESSSHLYTTGMVMEVDRCASAWVIKRFVDREAIFKYYPENSLITEGIIFDRPEGNLRRTHTAATFEVILKKFGIADNRLKQMAALMHDIEINLWGKKTHPDAKVVKDAIQKIKNKAADNEDFYVACFSYFEEFYNKLPIQPTR